MAYDPNRQKKPEIPGTVQTTSVKQPVPKTPDLRTGISRPQVPQAKALPTVQAPAQPANNVTSFKDYVATVKEAKGTPKGNHPRPDTTKGSRPAPTSTNASGTNASTGGTRLDAMSEYLQKQRDGYLGTQEAALGKARDDQIAELQKALEDAVSQGNISVREAEAAFAEQKGEIEQGTYNQSQATTLMMGELGIQNSQQAVGLRQGDAARSTSLLSKTMTERDRRVADIKDRVTAIKNKTNLDVANANANHDYALAGATGQADMQMNTQLFDLHNQEYQLDRSEGFQKSMAQLAQQYTLEQFAVQQGYNLETMDVQQKYQLEQMYNGHIYNLAMQNDMQGWQSGENQADRGLQWNMQNNQFDWQSSENQADRSLQWNMQTKQFEWQSSENAMDRNHQSDMQNNQFAWQSGENAMDRGLQWQMQNNQFNWQSGENAMDRAQQTSMQFKQFEQELTMYTKQFNDSRNAMLEDYDLAVSRELNKYQPGTNEYQIAQSQAEIARQMAEQEFAWGNRLQIASEIMANGETPIDPGPKPKKPEKSWYQDWRSKFAGLGIGISQENLEKKRLESYNAELKAWEQASEAYKLYKSTIGN